MVISLLIPVLTDYAQTLTEGGDVLSARASGFSPVAVWGDDFGYLEDALRERRRVVVSHVDSEEDAKRGLEEGLFSMVLGPSSRETGTLAVVLNRGDPRSISAWTTLEVIADSRQIQIQRETIEAEIARAKQLEGMGEAEARSLARNLSDLYIEPIRITVSEVSRETSGNHGDGDVGSGSTAQSPGAESAGVTPLTSSSFLSLVFMSLGLCFPLLSGSGMMIESITGEKEQRTIEGLLGSSVTRGSILLGKFSAAYTVTAVQSIALILILSTLMEMDNLLWVVLCLLAVAIAVLSATTLVSVVSRTMKEANLAITILYVLVFVLFFGPLMLPGTAAWISPFTPVIRLAAGDAMPLASALAPLAASVIFGLACLMVCMSLFSRDDVVFGPRPSFRGLLADLVSSRVQGLRGMVLLAAGFGSLASVPAILLPGLFFLPSVAFMGRWGFVVAFAGAALVEEYFKPYGVYLLGGRIGRRTMIALGALSGLSFSLVENLLFTLALAGTGYLQGSVLLVRYLFAPALHVGLSAIVVAGYSGGRRSWAAALVIASCMHAAYNLGALLAVF